ncbi:MAG: glycoside-pentoside-hexuronide (GPH):cation symporter [Oscillospiraceae bacterium]
MKHNKNKLSYGEIAAYSASGFGQNLISGLVTSYIMIFYTDVFGISAMAAAIIMFCARFFDAFNDPIIGSIVDRTRTKWGKLRPYMLFTALPISALTILCFTTPNISYAGKVAYAATMYIAWGVVFTTMDVPYWGLSSAMTSDTDDRNKLLTFARLAGTCGGGILTIAVPFITGHITNGIKNDYLLKYGAILSDALKSQMQTDVQMKLQPAYFWIAISCAIIGAPLFLFAFLGTKERTVLNENPPSLKHNISLILKNRPLLLIIASSLLGSLRYVYISMFLYLAKYNLGNESLAAIMSVMVVPLGLFSTILTPFFSKKLGKKNLYIITHIFQSIILAFMFFVGYSSTSAIVILAICLVLLGLPSGFNSILTCAMTSDSVDYLELTTGERGEGICFSMQTFMGKASMAISSLAIGITLGAVLYVPNDFSPSESVLSGLYFLATMGAAISSALAIIPMLFYTFTEKEQKKAREIIERRNNQKL